MHARAELKRSVQVSRPAAHFTQRSTTSLDAPKTPHGACACGGSCPRCKAATGCRVSQPGDASERAADAMAHAALAGDAVAGHRAARPETRRPQSAPSELIPGAGEPLAPSLCSEFEGRFGADFSGVRIHRDARAACNASALQARAFAVGSHIAFGVDEYRPATPAGRALLAHELAHVIHDGRVAGADRPTVHRQLQIPLPIPGFDKINPCIIVPEGLPAPFDILGGQEVCGATAEKVICFITGKCKDKPPERKPADCSAFPGFKPGGSSAHLGECCRGIESDDNCCPPERLAFKDLRCCKDDEVVSDGHCVKSSSLPNIVPPQICPPDRLTAAGECCVPPLVSRGDICVLPEAPPQPPPQSKPRPKPKVAEVQRVAVGFEKDAPQSWYHPAAAFDVSVTGSGKKAFDSLVKLLAAQPDLKVQLAGNASIEKPAGDPGYNQRLTERRVQLIARELMRRGIDAARIADPSDTPSLAGCDELEEGVHACGDTGAQDTTLASDRNVTARVFREPSRAK